MLISGNLAMRMAPGFGGDSAERDWRRRVVKYGERAARIMLCRANLWAVGEIRMVVSDLIVGEVRRLERMRSVSGLGLEESGRGGFTGGDRFLRLVQR